ncbi:unnamed protein product, partial [marine sediment metagenome]
YSEYEFNSIDALIENWAKGDYLTAGLAIEEKYDGFRMVLHNDDGQTKMYTEDKKRDRSESLVGIESELRKFPDCILDSEVVAYDEAGKALPRHESTRIIAAKGEVTGNIKANVFDCLYYEGKSLVEKPWNERQAILKKVLPKDTKYLHRVIPIIAHSAEQLKNALAREHSSIFMSAEEAILEEFKMHIDLYILRDLVRYNFGSKAPLAYWEFESIAPEVKSLLRDLIMAMVAGDVIRPDANWIAETLGLKLR